MIPFDTSSLCLLAAILTPLSAGLILLFGARFSQSSLRAVSVVGFATPLIIALALYCQFECHTADYRFGALLPVRVVAYRWL